MWRTKLNCTKFQSANLLCLVVALLLATCFPARSMAKQPGQKTFSSAEEASDALFKAEQNNDEKALLDILGPDAEQIVSSGDAAEDADSRANFVRRYQEMHRLTKEPDGTTTLYIGAENWPTPIPLVNKGNSWYFDTQAGKSEILYRRIGRNELSAISVCEELVAAQKEYSSAQHNAYARKIRSDQGQHDGLYWKAAQGEPQSPVGPLVAAAFVQDDSQSPEGAPTAYRGYYYRIVTGQAGNSSGEFVFVAYPAVYRSSGVMTFIVNQDGVVYQKDLGNDTENLAKAIKEYNPDSSWQKAEDEQEEIAGDQKTQ